MMARKGMRDGKGLRERSVDILAELLERKGAKSAKLPRRLGVFAFLFSARRLHARFGACR
jgi:hypothetical protein